MNDQILYTDEKRAIERWENEGGRCVGPILKSGSTAHE